jgi:hypothetical protein
VSILPNELDTAVGCEIILFAALTMLFAASRSRIHCSISSEESLRVAKVDISLGQTERLLIAYDRAYLHFLHAVVLGLCHVKDL